MHEAAIVQSVIDIAENEARKHGAPGIRKIKLKVGEFRSVVKEALSTSCRRPAPERLRCWSRPSI